MARGRPAVGTLQIGETVTLTFRAVATTPGSSTNRAEVSAQTSTDTDSAPANCISGGIVEDDCGSAAITVLAPAISLSKQVLVPPPDVSGTWLEADTAAAAPTYQQGAPVFYRFIVTNTGTTDLVDVAISDPLIDFFCDQMDGLTLPIGASITIECTYRVGWTAGPTGAATITNTAYVTGHAGTAVVTDSDQAIVAVEFVDQWSLNTTSTTQAPTTTAAPTTSAAPTPPLTVTATAVHAGKLPGAGSNSLPTLTVVAVAMAFGLALLAISRRRR